MSDTNITNGACDLATTQPLLRVARLALVFLIAMLVPASAWADHPCATDPNWPNGQLCSTDPSWPAGQDGRFYDPGCRADGDALNYNPNCMQEGEVNCVPAIPSTCFECWDCIDNDGDGLFDCMDNLDSEGNDSTLDPNGPNSGGCAMYCAYVSPLGQFAYDQDVDDDGYLACPFGAPDPAPSIYDCDDNASSIHSGATEDCTDGIDNNCDELIDADDPDCQGDDDDSSSAGDDDDSTPTGDDDDSTPTGDDDDSSSAGDDDDSASSGDDDDSAPTGGDGCSCSSTQSTTQNGLTLALCMGLLGLGVLRRQSRNHRSAG